MKIKNFATFALIFGLAFSATLSGCTKGVKSDFNLLRSADEGDESSLEQEGGESAKGSKAEDGIDIETSATEGKPTRPSEDGEGLPGYLVDPALVTIEVESDRVVVSAPAGTIKGMADPATVLFQVLLIKNVTAESLTKVSATEYIITDTSRLEDIYPLADGSFKEDFSNPGSTVIVFRLNQARDDSNITVSTSMNYVTVAFRDLSDEQAMVQPLTLDFVQNRYPESLTLQK